MLAYNTMTILLGSDVLRTVLIYCIITVYEFVPLFPSRDDFAAFLPVCV